MTEKYRGFLEYLAGLKPKKAVHWTKLYLRYGASDPYPGRLGDLEAVDAMSQLISGMNEIGIPGKKQEAFKLAILRAVQELLNELRGNEEADYVADLLACLDSLRLVDGIPFLVRLAQSKGQYFEDVQYGKFTLYTELLRVIFSFTLNRRTDRRLCSQVDKLAENGLADSQSAHLCFRHLYSVGKSSGWEHTPDLIAAYLGNPNIALDLSLNAFLDIADAQALAQQYPRFSQRLFDMAKTHAKHLDQTTPWGLFVSLVNSHSRYEIRENFTHAKPDSASLDHQLLYDPSTGRHVLFCEMPTSESLFKLKKEGNSLLITTPEMVRAEAVGGRFKRLTSTEIGGWPAEANASRDALLANELSFFVRSVEIKPRAAA
jgi:hypothetical protein